MWSVTRKITLETRKEQVISALAAVALGRPEAGYSYSAPSSPSAPGGGGYPSGPSGPSAPAPQYGAPAQPPTIHKHVYVHVPPPETDYPAPRKPITVAPPQKHYKIIFIKAPTPPTPTAPVIPAQPQNEEKTLVYVLVKRPEPEPEITIPTPAPTQPSKPEVYFIRYKTQNMRY
ncbi:hypothetical protein NQ318_016571 [Aromia moschata]|uniref:DUF243 domain-containing protein n=1 Tax=Aromia moschata TaxID=1265417 RepID=A0AAV8YWR5_9CUCU|nr:hypothetical protein NQ318_016571 [Aromia moschata]